MCVSFEYQTANQFFLRLSVSGSDNRFPKFNEPRTVCILHFVNILIFCFLRPQEEEEDAPAPPPPVEAEGSRSHPPGPRIPRSDRFQGPDHLQVGSPHLRCHRNQETVGLQG